MGSGDDALLLHPVVRFGRPVQVLLVTCRACQSRREVEEVAVGLRCTAKR